MKEVENSALFVASENEINTFEPSDEKIAFIILGLKLANPEESITRKELPKLIYIIYYIYNVIKKYISKK